jgi:hypothetical protein
MLGKVLLWHWNGGWLSGKRGDEVWFELQRNVHRLIICRGFSIAVVKGHRIHSQSLPSSATRSAVFSHSLFASA